MCDLLRQAKYTIDSLEEELRLTRIGRDSCNKFLFYKEEECAALQKKLSAAESKVERFISLVCKSAPVTWASPNWLDEALKWENEAKDLIDSIREK